MIILTNDERRKFVLWLRQDAESNRMLLKQLETMPHAAPIARRKKQEIAACLIVADMLDSTETQTIG